MALLSNYEMILGQLVNLTKSYMCYHEKVSIVARNKIRTTGIIGGSFPFIYVGCSMLYKRKKICHFEDPVKKVCRRVMAWHRRLLTYGGKHVLVCNVLHSMLIYLVLVINPPNGRSSRLNKLWPNLFGERLLV